MPAARTTDSDGYQVIELVFEHLLLRPRRLPHPAARCQRCDTPNVPWRRFWGPVGDGPEMEKAMIVDHGLDLRFCSSGGRI